MKSRVAASERDAFSSSGSRTHMRDGDWFAKVHGFSVAPAGNPEKVQLEGFVGYTVRNVAFQEPVVPRYAREFFEGLQSDRMPLFAS